MATIARTETERAPGRPRMSYRRYEELMAYLLISPWIIGFLWFILGPMVTSLGLSFADTDMFTIKFVGFDNYIRLLSTDVTISLFWKSLYNTAYYVFLSIPLVMVIGFMIAVLLNQEIAARGPGNWRRLR